MNRHRQGVRLLSVMVLAACFSSAAVPRAVAAESAATLPILGVDPLASGTVLEDHADAVAHWVGRGLTGAVLLHIGAGHGMGSIAAEYLAAPKGLGGDTLARPRADRGRGERLLNDGNFIRAAAALGIVREVVWIAPFEFPVEEDAEKQLKYYLASAGFSAQDSGTFQLKDGCFRGRCGEIPVIVCGRERLPAISEPVLVSIGAGYILPAATFRGTSFIAEIRSLFTALRAARYAVLDTVLAYSVRSGEVPPDLRWVGESVLQALQDPSIVLAARAPKRWAVMQRLSFSSTGGSQLGMQMLGSVLAELELQPHDPALLLYAAEAATSHGGGEQSLTYARQACRVEPGYCFGLREIGLGFFARGDIETGLGFFAAGEALLPGMEYRQLDYAIALMKVGRAAEALEALEKVRERNGAFPSGFLIGTVQLFREDRPAARRAFDAALAAVERTPDFQVMRGEIAQAIGIAAAFYREEGLKQQAERLAGDPRLRLLSPQPVQ